jgi:large subunit ribosomal protein L9
MELLLLKDVGPLGRRGAVVKVADGYARNYLLPRGLAIPATARNKTSLAQQLARETKKAAAERGRAEEDAARLTNVALTFAKLANETGELYGSVSAAEVAQALEERGFTVDKKHVTFNEPVVRLGVFTAVVKLYEGVEAPIPVTVVKPEG